MIISPGPFLCLFALAAALPFVIVSLVKRRGLLYILLGSFVYWYVTVCLTMNVFPLRLGEMLSPFQDDGRIFGFIIMPFYYFPSGFDFISALFCVYWESMVYSLLLGFAAVLTFKSLRKILNFCIFGVSFGVVSAASIIITDLILGGVNKNYDISDTIVGLAAMLIGYIAASAVLRLVPRLACRVDYKAAKVKREKEEKIRRRKVEISDSV